RSINDLFQCSLISALITINQQLINYTALDSAERLTRGSCSYEEGIRKDVKVANIKRATNKLAIATEEDEAHEPDTLFLPASKAVSRKESRAPGTPRVLRKTRGLDNCPQDQNESSKTAGEPTTSTSMIKPNVTVSPDIELPTIRQDSEKSSTTAEKPKAASIRRPSSGPANDNGKKAGGLGVSMGLSTSRDIGNDVADDSEDIDVVQKEDKKKIPQHTSNVSDVATQKSQVKKTRKKQQLGEYDGKILVAVDFELQYTPEGYNWGFLIPADAKRQTWFKLELYPEFSRSDSALVEQFPDDRAAPSRYDRNAESIVQDYLTALREHFEAVLHNSIPASVATTIPIEYIVTVPAVWSAAAKAKTRACAEKAGMGEGSTLKIVSEPEAAAVYALQHMSVYDLVKGDVFVVCDAGGGTVDLVSYRINTLKPILRVVEVAPGQGELCGSTFLNRRFTAFLRGKLGTHPAFREDMLEEAIKKFENEIKPSFNGSNDEEYEVLIPAFPDSAELNVRRMVLCVSGADLHGIFEPVIQKILTLVTQQITSTEKAKSKVKAVLLVGGFGESHYLHKRIRESVAGRPIEVLKSPAGWTAVVRGALLKGLVDANTKIAAAKVCGRVARAYYGTESAKKYDASIHEPEQRSWSDSNKRWEATTFDWFIEKHETIDEKKPRRFDYHIEQPVSEAKLDTVDVTIVKCVDPVERGPPTYASENRVEVVEVLKVDLSKIPTKNLTKRTGAEGEEYYIIDYAVRVTCYSAETVYELLHNGRNYGRVSAEYV
ncbi:MAG: hypothetical protein LQ349_008631, partial [Xanthoria aureola]